MEGYLNKWTNYLNGWQMRWFILNDGVLSYYNSKEESLNCGYKMSFKINATEILVNKSDDTRLDLIIANDQHLYLKMKDYRERQKWLVALVSQKASHPSINLNMSQSSSQFNESSSTPRMSKSLHSIDTISQHSNDMSDLLKLKQSELKLYCEMLTQQANDFKKLLIDLNLVKLLNQNSTTSLVNKQADHNIETTNDQESNFDSLKKIDEMTSSINLTCDMVTQIVKNLMLLSNVSTNIGPDAVNELLASTKSEPASAIQHHSHQNKHLTPSRKLKQIEIDENESTMNFLIQSEEEEHLPKRVQQQHDLTGEKHSQHQQQQRQALAACANKASHFIFNFGSINKSTVLKKRTLKKNLPIIHKLNNFKLNNTNSALNASTTKIACQMRNCDIETLKETALVYLAESQNKVATSTILINSNTQVVQLQEPYDNLEKESKMSNGCGEVLTESLTIIQQSNELQSYANFFTILPHKFTDLQLVDHNEIPTEYFLECCSDMFGLLNNLGSTAFLPVKIDVYGNINKLKQKYSRNTRKYHTLQSIVQDEINENVTNAKNSATDALLWLKRAIWFMREFFHTFSKNELDMTECVLLSYQNSLKRYHNWVVRSIFSVALRSLPSKEDFLRGLALNTDDFLNNRIMFESELYEVMRSNVSALDLILINIEEFYKKNRLEN